MPKKETFVDGPSKIERETPKMETIEKYKKLVYISGPLTDITRWEIEKKAIHLRFVGWKLVKMGYCPIVPHWFGDHLTKEDFENIKEIEVMIIEADCEVVRRCDAICMCKGWEKSNGANQELNAAVKSSKKIFIEMEDGSIKRMF